MAKSKHLKAILFAVLSVTLFYFFVTPVYTSDDDIFYLFTLSGGFGSKPSNLLSVESGWHPMYGWLVKTLFVFFPRVNWYTVFLLFFHITGLSAIFFYLQNRFAFTTALIFYLLLFGLFETRLLINPDFTSSALFMATGGSLLMTMKERKSVYLGMLFLLSSLLLRFHISALIILLFMPVLLFSASANIVKNILRLSIIAVLWLFFNLVQIGFYKKNIPGWSEKNTFRKSFYYLANHPIAIKGQLSSTDQAEYNLIQTGFIYDQTKFNTFLLTKFSQLGYSPRNLLSKSMRSGLYWFFVNDKIYFGLLFSVALLLFSTNRRAFFKSLMFTLLPVVVWFILTISFKMTLAISFALFLGIYFYLVNGFKLSILEEKKVFKWIIPIFLVGFLLWSGKLVVNNNRRNAQQLESFHCMVDLLQHNKKNMFIASGYNISLAGVPALASPANYSVGNLLYYQRVLVEDCRTILQQNGIIDSFPVWLSSKRLNVIGEPPALLSQYCWENYGNRIIFQQDSANACLPIYKAVSSH